jgi:hypothetical protein
MVQAMRVLASALPLAAAVSAVESDVAPPVISLSLEGAYSRFADTQMAQQHICQDGTANVDSWCAHESFVKVCQVLTDTPTSCPEPEASVYDHHDEASVPVQIKRVLERYRAPGSGTVTSPGTEVSNLGVNGENFYNMRGIYQIDYNAVDRAGNSAQSLHFAMQMNDEVAPHFLPRLTTLAWESCSPVNVWGTHTSRRYFTWTDGSDSNDLYDGDVSTHTAIKIFKPDGQQYKQGVTGGGDIEIDTKTTGDWKITYTACDYADIFGHSYENNCADHDFTLQVYDTEAPEVMCIPESDHWDGSVTVTGAPTETITTADQAFCSNKCFTSEWDRVLSAETSAQVCRAFTFDTATNECGLYTSFDAAGQGTPAFRSYQCAHTEFLECDTAVGYGDPGAYCIDNRDSLQQDNDVISVNNAAMTVTTTGTVTMNVPATYTISYTCADASTNPAFKERTITVQDTTPADVSVTTPPQVVQLESGQAIPDPVYTCLDKCHGNCTDTVEYKGYTLCDAGAGLNRTLDTCCTGATAVQFSNQLNGEYFIQYSFQDQQGFDIQSCHDVTVVDVGMPVLNLIGSDPVTVEASLTDPYDDAHATCSDTVDGQIDLNIVATPASTVDRTHEGTYTMTYNCADSSGVDAVEVTRVVVVEDTTKPVCTIPLAGAHVTMEASFPYADAQDAVCTDTIDGDVNVTTWSFNTQEDVSEIVNVETTGTYFITYRAKDLGSNSNWNDNGPVRTVVVIDSLKPVIGVFDNKHLISLGNADDTGVNNEVNPAANGPPVPHGGLDPTLPNDPVVGHIYHQKYWDDAGLMAEGSSHSRVAWAFGAFGSAVVGVALLAQAAKRQQQATTVPV